MARLHPPDESARALMEGSYHLFFNLFTKQQPTFFKWGAPTADGTRHCIVVTPEDSNNTDPSTLQSFPFPLFPP
jgi:hypothetical protein